MRELFGEEHEAFREGFRAFVERDAVRGGVFARAGENGFLGMQVPEEYGGGGADDPRFAVVAAEEFMRAGLTGLGLAYTTHTGVAIPLLTAWADADQQARWLPDLASGGRLAAVLGAPVRWTPSGDRLRLDGVVTGVVNGATADLVVVLARSESGEQRVAVVEATVEGLNRKPGPTLLGVDGADLADVYLDGVEVPASGLLGGGAADQARVDEQLWLAVLGVAGVRTVLGWTLDYVRERTVFGRPVAAFENTRYVLADLLADLTVAESHVDTCVRARADGRLTAQRAAAAKLRCTELFGRAADQGLQLHGGYGYIREYPIAQAFADARYLRLHGGSSEVMKEILATELGV